MNNEKVFVKTKTINHCLEGMALYCTSDPCRTQPRPDSICGRLDPVLPDFDAYRLSHHRYDCTAIHSNVDNNYSNCFSFKKILAKITLRRF